MLESLLESVLIEADRRNEDVLIRAFRKPRFVDWRDELRKWHKENPTHGDIIRSIIEVQPMVQPMKIQYAEEWGRLDPWDINVE